MQRPDRSDKSNVCFMAHTTTGQITGPSCANGGKPVPAKSVPRERPPATDDDFKSLADTIMGKIPGNQLAKAKFATALRQLQCASDNLSGAAAENGMAQLRAASQLIAYVVNALQHGSPYRHAAELGAALDAETVKRD